MKIGEVWRGLLGALLEGKDIGCGEDEMRGKGKGEMM